MSTSKFQVTSNEEASPRDLPLLGEGVTPISYLSYEGTGNLYGITEYAELSDPPKKYRDAVPRGVGLARQVTSDNEDFGSICFGGVSRTRYDNAGAKVSQIGVYESHRNIGAPYNQFTLRGEEYDDTPWMLGASGGYGASYDSMEDWAPSGGDPVFSGGWNGRWSLDWIREKRRKYVSIFDIPRLEGEELFSPSSYLASTAIGDTTNSDARCVIVCHAVRGPSNWVIHIYTQMNQHAVGAGPDLHVYIQSVDGNRKPSANVLDSARQARGQHILFTKGWSGSGSDYRYGRTVLPDDSSFTFRVEIGDTLPANFIRALPEDWEEHGLGWSNPGPSITSEEMAASGNPDWYYLPVGVEGDVSEVNLSEHLCNEDSPISKLVLNVPDVIEWARTTSFTGGVTAESHGPIAYDMRFVRASFPLNGLEVGKVYPFRLNYQNRDIDSIVIDESSEVIYVTAVSAYQVVEVEVVAEVGRERRLDSVNLMAGSNPPVSVSTLQSETVSWKARVAAAGGSYTTPQLTALDGLHYDLRQIDLSDILRENIYLMPLCGNDLAAAMCPSIDHVDWGVPTNFNDNLIESDYDPLIGLKGSVFSSSEDVRMLLAPFPPGDQSQYAHVHGTGWRNYWSGFGLFYTRTDTEGLPAGLPATYYDIPYFTQAYTLDSSGAHSMQFRGSVRLFSNNSMTFTGEIQCNAPDVRQYKVWVGTGPTVGSAVAVGSTTAGGDWTPIVASVCPADGSKIYFIAGLDGGFTYGVECLSYESKGWKFPFYAEVRKDYAVHSCTIDRVGNDITYVGNYSYDNSVGVLYTTELSGLTWENANFVSLFGQTGGAAYSFSDIIPDSASDGIRGYVRIAQSGSNVMRGTFDVGPMLRSAYDNVGDPEDGVTPCISGSGIDYPMGVIMNPSTSKYRINYNGVTGQYSLQSGADSKILYATQDRGDRDFLLGAFADGYMDLYLNGVTVASRTDASMDDILDYPIGMLGQYHPLGANLQSESDVGLFTFIAGNRYIWNDATEVNKNARATALYNAYQTYLQSMGRIP